MHFMSDHLCSYRECLHDHFVDRFVRLDEFFCVTEHKLDFLVKQVARNRFLVGKLVLCVCVVIIGIVVTDLLRRELISRVLSCETIGDHIDMNGFIFFRVFMSFGCSKTCRLMLFVLLGVVISTMIEFRDGVNYGDCNYVLPCERGRMQVIQIWMNIFCLCVFLLSFRLAFWSYEYRNVLNVNI